jgi:hypothetical protein
VLGGRPSGHVVATLADQAKDRVRFEAVNLTEIRADS